MAPTNNPGIVDGEDTGENMGLGYDDSNAPTDQGGDQITNGDDTIYGGEGNDTLAGEAGNDTISGGEGDNVIDGGTGDDTITAGSGDDTITGGEGNDSISAGDGTNVIDAGEGNNTVTSGSGADTIDSGLWNWSHLNKIGGWKLGEPGSEKFKMAAHTMTLLGMGIELSRVDDPYDDDCVDVEFFQAYGEPLLGTDGGVLAGQTLLRNPDTPTSKIEGATLDCGTLEARPMNLDLPLGILDAFFELNMTDGGLRLDLGEDGIHSGFFTGSLLKEEVLEILYSSDGIDDDIRTLVEGLLDTTLDMDPDGDGVCTELSAGLEFQAGEIFIAD